MKQILRLSFIIAVFLTTLSTYAVDQKDDYALYIKTRNGKIVNFTLKADEKSNFSILDEKQNLLYTGEFSTNELEVSKTFILETYPVGTYYLKVLENNKVVNHKITVYAKTSKVIALDRSVNESPAFRR